MWEHTGDLTPRHSHDKAVQLIDGWQMDGWEWPVDVWHVNDYAEQDVFFFFFMLSSCKWWNILINLKARIDKILFWFLFICLLHHCREGMECHFCGSGESTGKSTEVPQVLSLKRRHFMPQYGCVTSLEFRYGVSFSNYESYGMPLLPPRCRLFLLCWRPSSAFAACKINGKKTAVTVVLQMSRRCADTWQKCTKVVTKK